MAKQLVDRGLPNNKPTPGPRSSGIGAVQETVPPASAQAQRAQIGAVPGDAEGVIRQAEQSGTEATQAGAEGKGPRYGQHANAQNLPPEVRGLVADDGYHVP